MSLRRYGNTDYQENALASVERLAKKLNFRLGYGTSIGKSPQTVVLDHHYQDGFMSVSSDSEWGIRVNDKKVSLAQLKDIMISKLKPTGNILIGG